MPPNSPRRRTVEEVEYKHKAKFRDLFGMFFALIGILFTWLAVLVGGAYTSDVILKTYKK